jgi:myo-inositol-1(or 4)-monophosphatase
MNPESLIQQMTTEVAHVGAYIQQSAHTFDRNSIQDKSLNQLVSEVDKNAEAMLVEKLGKIFPDAGFIGEENTYSTPEDSEYTWVIDPLDGTTNFLHGLPVYCISVGLMHVNTPVAGVIYDIERDEMFYASKGSGSFMNNKKLSVTAVSNLQQSLIATGFPYHDFGQMDPYLRVLDYLMRHSRGLRRMGSAAIDLAYTACGRFDGFFEFGLSPWDVAAGVVIIEEAGGVCMDMNRGTDCIFGQSIIAGNSAITDELHRVIALHFSHP